MLCKSLVILCMLNAPAGVWLIWYDSFNMYILSYSFSKNKNHCYCNFLCLNFPFPKCAQCAFFPISVINFINIWFIKLRNYDTEHKKPQKVVKCYLVQLPQLSYMYWPVYFNQRRHNVGWFLLQKFVGLFRVYYLYIISRKHPNVLLLISLQKAKTCPK